MNHLLNCCDLWMGSFCLYVWPHTQQHVQHSTCLAVHTQHACTCDLPYSEDPVNFHKCPALPPHTATGASPPIRAITRVRAAACPVMPPAMQTPATQTPAMPATRCHLPRLPCAATWLEPALRCHLPCRHMAMPAMRCHLPRLSHVGTRTPVAQGHPSTVRRPVPLISYLPSPVHRPTPCADVQCPKP